MHSSQFHFSTLQRLVCRRRLSLNVSVAVREDEVTSLPFVPTDGEHEIKGKKENILQCDNQGHRTRLD